MIQQLRHWLIPSKKNNFHPKSLRPIGLSIVVLVLAFIPTLYNLASTQSMQVLGYASNISIGDLHAISNDQRAGNGVGALSLNGTLNQAAANKAAHMFANNYWAHNAPDGTTPWAFMSGAGYSYALAGENLAKGFSTSSGVVTGWMNSPGHRANVLNSGFKDVGYAVMNGTLLGEETTLVVAMYGATNVSAPPPAPAPAPTPAPAAAPAPAPAAPTTPIVEEAPEPTPAEVEEQAKAEEAAKEAEKETEEAAATPATTNSAPPTEQSPSDVAGAIISAPVEAYTGLNWGQKTSIFIMCTLALLFIMKHTMIWRSQKNGLRNIWLRAHPLAQASFLIFASIITLLSGTGTIL